VTVKDIRLSFPSLFTARAFAEGGTEKFSATALMEKGSENHQRIEAAMRAVASDKWGANVPSSVIYCLRDGETKDGDGYGSGVVFFGASSTRRPTVVNRRVEPVVEGDRECPYAGCYVNLTCTIWAQDNQYGKRVNAEINAVQFVRDGDAFGAAPIRAEDCFEDLEAADDGADLM
jgi:hypothetical protein